jgi:hypothetical protein
MPVKRLPHWCGKGGQRTCRQGFGNRRIATAAARRAQLVRQGAALTAPANIPLIELFRDEYQSVASQLSRSTGKCDGEQRGVANADLFDDVIGLQQAFIQARI